MTLVFLERCRTTPSQRRAYVAEHIDHLFTDSPQPSWPRTSPRDQQFALAFRFCHCYGHKPCFCEGLIMRLYKVPFIEKTTSLNLGLLWNLEARGRDLCGLTGIWGSPKEPPLPAESIKATSPSSELCWFRITVGRGKATLERTAEHWHPSAPRTPAEDLLLVWGTTCRGSRAARLLDHRSLDPKRSIWVS